MKKFLLLVSLAIVASANQPTCKALYYDLEMKSAQYSLMADDSEHKSMLKMNKALGVSITSYKNNCCKTQECKDEMINSIYELEETEIALIALVKNGH